jgi:hypothetical protein
MLPKLYIVPLDELLGTFHRGLIVGAHKSNCSADKTVFVHDVSSILGHIDVTPKSLRTTQSRGVCPVPDSETLCSDSPKPRRSSCCIRARKVRPRISPRPDPIGAGYIRPCLRFLHCVTLIAAVATKRRRTVNAASSGSGAMRLGVPADCDQVFRLIATTHSGRSRPGCGRGVTGTVG